MGTVFIFDFIIKDGPRNGTFILKVFDGNVCFSNGVFLCGAITITDGVKEEGGKPLTSQHRFNS